jgi:FAD-dependent urate hydroxylase
MGNNALSTLEVRVTNDLHALRHPEPEWMPERHGPEGAPLLDVLVVGAGQSGLAICAQLLRERVDNIVAIDAAEEGKEGVWNSFARMPILRSPPHMGTLDLGTPSLTYQAWHEATYGEESFAALELIPIDAWCDYLVWYRKVLSLPVRNGVTLTRIVPADGCLAAHVSHAHGDEILYARKIALCTGHDGTGRWWMPGYIEALPSHLRAHAADEIDFAALAGKRVAVLGIGASATDQAVEALKAGAAEVHQFCRRDTHRRKQVYRWLMFAGFMRHLGDLDDLWRWRFMRTVLNTRMGMPPETWRRVNAYANYHLHTDASWHDAKPQGDGVRLDVAGSAFDADFVICGTGHDEDIGQRPELAELAQHIATWADRYSPPEGEDDARLGRYPYLNRDYAFEELTPGSAPHLRNIHDFTFGPTMSFGPSGCSIATLRVHVPQFVAGITRGLFQEDAEYHFRRLQDFDVMIP